MKAANCTRPVVFDLCFINQEWHVGISSWEISNLEPDGVVCWSETAVKNSETSYAWIWWAKGFMGEEPTVEKAKEKVEHTICVGQPPIESYGMISESAGPEAFEELLKALKPNVKTIVNRIVSSIRKRK